MRRRAHVCVLRDCGASVSTPRLRKGDFASHPRDPLAHEVVFTWPGGRWIFRCTGETGVGVGCNVMWKKVKASAPSCLWCAKDTYDWSTS